MTMGIESGHEECGTRCWRALPAVESDDGVPAVESDGRVPAVESDDGVPAAESDGRAPAVEPGDGARFRILFVCTGNICRSPLAERMTRAALGPCPAVQVISAGTQAEPGLEMAEGARRVLARLGGDPAGFGSRPLTPELVAAADLVLTATCEHRARAVDLHLAAAGRVFTIAEFGALAEAVPPAGVPGHPDPALRARALVGQARALRGLVRVARPDIADPYGGSWLAYRAAGRRITRSLAVPLRLLRHPPAS
ncbi:protein-tyrosine phosphatase [Streptosporangium becharense]|uniref:Protein-tyrosine phosphatase n=1 Tax=Streptosporangium becharense TaxID=1816182 RepID=A0A7W9IKZ6_9ACTN|nr:protein-tyrosine-phosphatase [Streptosporangium becharense]MBB2911641.1 protein-tyrosine phosphatase [Streptosporangium becharense]MBB5822541.1 protein-tyrosine phosphatase [Streptosporangium becharense]